MDQEKKQIWVYPEINLDAAPVNKISLGLLSEACNIARKVEGRTLGLVFGVQSDERLLQGFSQYGLDAVHQFKDAAFQDYRAGPYASALAEKIRAEKPWLVLMGDTVAGREIAPRLAVLAKTGILTGCVRMDLNNPAQPVFSRPSLGGQVYQQVSFQPGETVVVTVDTGILNINPTQAVDIRVSVSEPAGVIVDDGVRHEEFIPTDFQSVDVTEADRIVAVGARAASDDLLPLARELSALIEGSLGATRPVVDDARLGKDRLIGQTGKVVSPEFYLALGISGASHHLGGIQEAGTIIAVNLDPAAPIFQNADLGFNVDLKELLPRLIDRLKQARENQNHR